jgi:hypothetical protein
MAEESRSIQSKKTAWTFSKVRSWLMFVSVLINA